MNRLAAYCALVVLTALSLSSVGSATEPDHYRLQRDVIRVAVSSNPIVRIQCTVRAKGGASDTVVFDPATQLGLVRYALLPKGSTNDLSLECVSERLELSQRAFTYLFVSDPAKEDPAKGAPATGAEGKQEPSIARLKGTWRSIVEETSLTPTIEVTISPASTEETAAALDELTKVEPSTKLRSLDPTTALVNDLLGTLATVALDRANEAGKQYVRSFLREHLCERLTVKVVSKELTGTSLAKVLPMLGWSGDRRLLQNTCALLETARLDELAAAKDAVWRAVAMDATDLASAFVGRAILDRVALGQEHSELERIFDTTRDLLGRAVLGATATTERDVQVLMLKLGRVGLTPNGPSWRCGLEAGLALLRECLRDNSCSADDLGQLIRQEIVLASQGGQLCDVAAAFRDWPELPTLLGRIGDVLKPPPGASPTLTAATAFDIILDTTVHVLTSDTQDESVALSLAQLANLQNQLTTLGTDKITISAKELERALAAGKNVDCSSLKEQPRQACLDAQKALTDFREEIDEENPSNDPENDRKTLKACQFERLAKQLETLSGDAPWRVAVSDLELTSVFRSGKGKKCDDSSDVTACRTAQGVLQDAEEAIFDPIVHNGSRRQAYALAMLRALRSVVAAVRGEDPSPVAVELGTVLKLAITEYCEEKSRCKAPVTTQNLHRSFAVITAMGTYGASYRSRSENGPEAKAEAAEERKKALETVIDAFTDRSNRTNEWVVSLGSNVSLGVQVRLESKKDAKDSTHLNKNPLGLPLGVAVQQLPGKDWWNFHAAVNFIDLAQFMAVSTETDKTEGNEQPSESKQVPEPEFATALMVGVEAGLLYGEPSFPISLSLNAGYVPRVSYETVTRDEWRFGAALGVFVPFIDFN